MLQQLCYRKMRPVDFGVVDIVANQVAPFRHQQLRHHMWISLFRRSLARGYSLRMISTNSLAIGMPALTEQPAPINRVQPLSRSLARLTVSRTSAISRRIMRLRYQGWYVGSSVAHWCAQK